MLEKERVLSTSKKYILAAIIVVLLLVVGGFSLYLSDFSNEVSSSSSFSRSTFSDTVKVFTNEGFVKGIAELIGIRSDSYCNGVYTGGNWDINSSISCSNEIIDVTGILKIKDDTHIIVGAKSRSLLLIQIILLHMIYVIIGGPLSVVLLFLI